MPPYEEYIEEIKALWDSHWLTNMGTYHQKLERLLKKYLGVPYLSLMVNGHMALELVLCAMDFPDGSEVITTPFTFISTTHAIIRNHLKPIFCDVKLTDGTLDETKIESLITERTVAIVPVHVYGNVCNIEEIQKIADRFKLKVIYDAAHAFGIKYKGKGIGNYGDASVFSFHATKVFNTIEGGAVTFSNYNLYKKLYSLKNFGICGEELVSEIGVNGKMNEFCAIMGICNLRHVKHSIAKRRLRYEEYEEKLKDIKGISFFQRNPYADKNYGYFPILIEDDYPMERDELYCLLKKNGYLCRKYFYPLTCDQICFKDIYQNVDLRNARELSNRILTLPIYDELEFESIERIYEMLCKHKHS